MLIQSFGGVDRSGGILLGPNNGPIKWGSTPSFISSIAAILTQQKEYRDIIETRILG